MILGLFLIALVSKPKPSENNLQILHLLLHKGHFLFLSSRVILWCGSPKLHAFLFISLFIHEPLLLILEKQTALRYPSRDNQKSQSLYFQIDRLSKIQALQTIVLRQFLLVYLVIKIIHRFVNCLHFYGRF